MIKKRFVVVVNHVIDRDRVRMVQSGGDPGLAHRPTIGLLSLGIAQLPGQQQLLDRDAAV
jgi:hypothetical protein